MRQNGNAQLDPGRPGRPAFRISRRGIIGVSAISAMLIAVAITAIAMMGGGPGTSAPPAAADTSHSATSGHGGGANSASAARMPELVAAPQVAVMPKGAAGHPSMPGASSSATSSPASGHPSPGGSSAAPSNSPTTPPTGSGSGSCTHPQYVTSDPNGMWNLAPYFVANNMWNASNYAVSQTLYACSYSDWYVVATANNNNGDGAVKTYPDSHRDFDSEPQINSFNSVTSTFAETSPHVGIYEDAYDIWLNGVASSTSTEVMIWTENFNQTPCCTNEGTVTFDGRSYTAWKNGSYIAFVANANFTSGNLNLLEFFKWIIGKGWIPGNSTLGAVDYGVEVVSTNSAPATFTFSNFSVNTS